MSKSKLPTFAEALKEAGRGRKHVLLGNGFSIAWRKYFASYGSLRKTAMNRTSGTITGLLQEIRASDFESVMRSLDRVRRILLVYGVASRRIQGRLAQDIESLPQVLIDALLHNHPKRPNEIEDSQYKLCSKFLSKFAMVFTLNYDLLLYWVEEEQRKKNGDGLDDGFGGDDPYWKVWERRTSQVLFFLHGALHLSNRTGEIRKRRSRDGEGSLVPAIRNAMNQREFPMVICDGNSNQKLERITRNPYLTDGLGRLRNLKGSLFLFGWSMSRSDDHIVEALKAPSCQLDGLFVSRHASVTRRDWQRISRRCREIRRTQKCKLCYFDAGSAEVWHPVRRRGDA